MEDKESNILTLSEAPSAFVAKDYSTILKKIKIKIKEAQSRAMISANRELLSVYFYLGKIIYKQQKTAKWGDSIVEKLANDLQNSFPGMKGFSSRNLWIMKDLYVSYKDNEKLQTLSAEISWSHNVAILSKCPNLLQREFYMRMSKKKGWSYRVLLNQISNCTYERTMSSQTNFDKNLPKEMHFEAKLAVKDEYIFGFLDLI